MSEPPYRGLRIILGIFSLIAAVVGLVIIFSNKPMIMRLFLRPPESEVSTLLLIMTKEMGGFILMLSVMLFFAYRDPARNVAIVNAFIVGLCVLAITPLLSLYTLDMRQLYPSYLIWGRSLVRLAIAALLFGARVRGAQYDGVGILNYNPKNLDWSKLLRSALGMSGKAIEKSTGNKSESCAILTPSGFSVARITAALSSGSNPIPHKVLFDEAEVLLAARLAAFLLEPKPAASFDSDVALGLELLATVRRARGSNAAVQDAAKYMSWAAQVRNGKSPKCKLVADMQGLMRSAGQLNLCGDPAKDWLLIKQVLRSANDPSIAVIAAHLDLLVAFKRGKRISANLSAMWSEVHCYPKARQALESALVEDQILAGVDDLSGIHVMTIHKSKGKQFDGVIILREGRRTSANGWASSFVWRGDQSPYTRSRKILRVAITRARKHVLFLNPVYPACPILSRHKLS
jgi:DNA helicase-2/ATP-dependent DNA helicase PcrA